MTAKEAKQKVAEWWDRWQWFVAVILIPLAVWAFKSYDAKKLDVHDFIIYSKTQDSIAAVHLIKDEQRDNQLDYLVCRQDFTRRECLRPDRP